MPTLAIDLMSGDRVALERLQAIAPALRRHASMSLLLVGDPGLIDGELRSLPDGERSRIRIIPATDVVAMDDRPRDAIRRRKLSSMRLAIDLVQSGDAEACVSAGNTGALTAMAHFVLRTLSRIERAAIMSAVPSADGFTYMLDLGANTSATAAQLLQFAQMGSVVARDVYAVANPRVGLLNIGDEDIKGHQVVQDAHKLIAAAGLNYIGFVEGDDIFGRDVDVVVTDGFTGNVALKAMEGLARFIAEQLRSEFSRDAGSKLAAMAAMGVLRRFANKLDPRRYNGACMVGLNGIVVKSHGSADAAAFGAAMDLAHQAVSRGLMQHVRDALAA
ncbi:MAG: phosphate acyltransferase PlsX [Steroidobacteraceae bacterium]